VFLVSEASVNISRGLVSLCPGYTANKHVVLNSTEYYVVNRVLPKNITEGQGGDLILLIAENINHLLPHKN